MMFDEKNSGFFIEPAIKRNKAKPQISKLRLALLFLISAVYAFALLAPFYFNTDMNKAFSLVIVYFYGIMGAIGIVLIKKAYTNTDRSRQLLSEVLERSAEARAITDADGNMIYANDAYCRLTQEDKPQDLTGFAALLHKNNADDDLLKNLHAKTADGGTHNTEVSLWVNAATAWFDLSCQPVKNWPGYTHWRFDNITTRHSMELTVREQQEKLRDFTDNAPVGFFSVDETGRFQFANDTLLRLLGTDAATMIGKLKLHDFLAHPPQNARAYDCFEKGGYHQHGELLMKGAGNRIFRAAVTHSITTDENNKLISRSIVYDLTAEHKMKQALEESQDRFERLFDEAPVGICTIDGQFIISNSNRMLCSILKITAADLNAKPLLSLVQGEAQEKLSAWLTKLAQAQQKEPFIEIAIKDISVQVFGRKFSGGDSFVLHFIDLTEKKKLESQFTQSQKMQAVGQLAGGIAHDFNNLLTAMSGFCDLLLLRHKPGDPSFADIMQIKQNSNRAAGLVRQLLAFSRQQTLQPRVLDVTDVLAELSHLLRRLIGANIELSLHHGTDLGLIRADQGQMEQVLINLVVNARDAMPQGGRITVQTQNITCKGDVILSNGDALPHGDWVAVSVEDTGTGIAPDVLPRIFEPFFSTKDVGAGTGLGLSTVHGIIHQTGGYISVHSVVGKGTTFTIYVPRHIETATEKKAAAAEEKAAASDLTGSARIMLVEDEDAVRMFSARALGNKGYKVMEAASGAVALKMLEDGKFNPEILVTDVMMPEMDGTTLAKHVREKYPHVKIIFISGYAEDKFKEHLGTDVWFLPKPFSLKQLATKVKEVLES